MEPIKETTSTADLQKQIEAARESLAFQRGVLAAYKAIKELRSRDGLQTRHSFHWRKGRSMSAPFSDPFLTAAAAQLHAARMDLAADNEAAGCLSVAEVNFASEAEAREAMTPWRPKGEPMAEIDAEIKIPGQKAIPISLAVYGKFVRGSKGHSPKGDRQIEPDEPPTLEIDAVMMGETDVTAEIGQDGDDAVAFWMMENAR